MLKLSWPYLLSKYLEHIASTEDNPVISKK